jgi:hypothetical protein
MMLNATYTILQLLVGKFYWWIKSEHPEKTEDLSQVTDKCCIEYSSPSVGFELKCYEILYSCIRSTNGVVRVYE